MRNECYSQYIKKTSEHVHIQKLSINGPGVMRRHGDYWELCYNKLELKWYSTLFYFWYQNTRGCCHNKIPNQIYYSCYWNHRQTNTSYVQSINTDVTLTVDKSVLMTNSQMSYCEFWEELTVWLKQIATRFLNGMSRVGKDDFSLVK